MGQPREYHCLRCGACCRWPGVVRLTEEDVDAAAAYLGLTPEAFLERYTQVSPDRRSLVLIDNSDGHCIMLTAAGLCRIHAAKPRQCRDFPKRWNFPGFERLCLAARTQGSAGQQDTERPPA